MGASPVPKTSAGPFYESLAHGRSRWPSSGEELPELDDLGGHETTKVEGELGDDLSDLGWLGDLNVFAAGPPQSGPPRGSPSPVTGGCTMLAAIPVVGEFERAAYVV
jgi:hypothetical protein